ELGGIETEDPRFERRVEGGIAVAVLELGGDREGAKSLDLRLRGAVPDGVGTPQDAPVADACEQLAKGVGGGRRVAQHLTPDGGDVDPDVAVGRHAVDVECTQEA